jgi:hypothetical protein
MEASNKSQPSNYVLTASSASETGSQSGADTAAPRQATQAVSNPLPATQNTTGNTSAASRTPSSETITGQVSDEEQERIRKKIKREELKNRKFKFNIRTLMGHMVMNKVSYFYARVQPGIRYGLLEVALDLNIEMYGQDVYSGALRTHKPGDVRKDEWSRAGAYPGKLLFLKFGDKYNYPVYVEAGRLSDITFATGFLVNRYTNTLYSPDMTKTGVYAKVDYVFAGAEGFVSDLADYDLMGARVFVRPFGLTDFRASIIGRMEFGFTYIADFNTDDADRINGKSYATYDGNRIKMQAYSVDAFMPIFKSRIISFGLSYVFAKIITAGFGHDFGIKGDIGDGKLLFKGGARYLRAGFMGPVVDSQWDVKKKYTTFGPSANMGFLDYLKSTGRSWGYYIELRNTWLKGKLGFYISYEDDGKKSPHFQLGFFMKKGVLSDRISFRFLVDKSNIKSSNWYEITDYDTRLEFEAAFAVTRHVDVAFVYGKTFTEDYYGTVIKLDYIKLETRITF